MRYTSTTYTPADGTTTTDYAEETAALLITRALGEGFTLTADADTAAITLTRSLRTVTLAPAEPLPSWTTAQRREVLTLAVSDEPLVWKWGNSNTPRLADGARWLAASTTRALMSGGYLALSNGNGTPARLSLLAYLMIGTRPSTRPKPVRDEALTAVLRNVYAPARTLAHH
ncbi:hypothetical protein QFZ75_008025 [Streptomyces sp. V3I8]|uniref:hypothetical protein n=1 Tax=Streptomyces sp. V3I8 TaxID=3042279 RepID=UPI002787E104|nr:hypothetical protein [Streptomyces sp. V3I8]MDQ1041523.1 hypothetical protein [Streptomyces sp. V3I8]